MSYMKNEFLRRKELEKFQKDFLIEKVVRLEKLIDDFKFKLGTALYDEDFLENRFTSRNQPKCLIVKMRR